MHIYKREFVESAGTQLVMPAGMLSMCWRLGFPQEGKITRMLLQQSAGVGVELTVNLYDRNVCDTVQYIERPDLVTQTGSSSSLRSQSSSLSQTPSTDQMTNALARIIPVQTILASAILELREGNDNGGPWSYRNREGSFTVPVRAVYLHIAIDDNDDGKEFELALEAIVGNESN